MIKEEKGLAVIMNDGSVEHYDPVMLPSGLTEDDEHYTIGNGYGQYKIDKQLVKEIKVYDLCSGCGHEYYPNEGCVKYGCVNNLCP